MAVALLAGLMVWGRTALPAHAATATVTTCNEASLDAAVNNAAPGDTITFGCSGVITLSQTLDISQDLTLDGSGQSVTLDGGHAVRVLLAQSGVHFTLNDLTIADGYFNSAFNNTGGGLANNGGTVTISNSAFTNNTGGGLVNNGGTVTISNSAITGNSQVFDGGGVTNLDDGTMTITNTTISGNSSYDGAGLYNSGGGLVTIHNSTITGNSAVYVGGGIASFSPVAVTNSIVADNAGGWGAADCYLHPIDDGYNLESGSDCGFFADGDMLNTDPMLASGPADNGGPTQTIALLAGSPAIDHIPAANCPATDQRGVARPDNGEAYCDIGAYEYQDPIDNDLALTNTPSNMTVDATSPSGAVVSYTPPTVVDADSPLPAVSCTPASGSTFAIGTTTVNCSVSDSDDTNSPVSASFTVTVVGAAAQDSALITTVNGLQLRSAVQNSFDAELTEILSEVNAGQTTLACPNLTDFIGHVQGQSGKSLTAAQAAQLVAAAQQIQAVLGC
jgi:hypothetical protein